MLKGIDPLLGPDLLWILAAMGHGDDIALVDGNHPAETIAAATASGRLVRLPGVAIERVAAAILSVLPIDKSLPDPIRRMEVVGKPDDIPAAQRAVMQVCNQAAGCAVAVGRIERFAFYGAARNAFAVVQAVDPRPYGCFLFRKGVLIPDPG